MKRILLALAACTSISCHASDGLSSELSHAAGGALLSGAITRFFETSEHRAWIGFAASASGILLAERPGLTSSDPSKVKSSRLDVTYHIVGAALGAWVTDRYILLPIVRPAYVGVVFVRSF
jgi:hypothetical protein